MEKKRYTLEGLDCAGCAAKIEAAVSKADFAENASVDFMHKRLTVQLKDGAGDVRDDIQKIADSVTSGVQVKEFSHEHEHHHEHHHKHHHEHHHDHDGACCCGHDHEHEHEHEHEHKHPGW